MNEPLLMPASSDVCFCFFPLLFCSFFWCFLGGIIYMNGPLLMPASSDVCFSFFSSSFLLLFYDWFSFGISTRRSEDMGTLCCVSCVELGGITLILSSSNVRTSQVPPPTCYWMSAGEPDYIRARSWTHSEDRQTYSMSCDCIIVSTPWSEYFRNTSSATPLKTFWPASGSLNLYKRIFL